MPLAALGKQSLFSSQKHKKRGQIRAQHLRGVEAVELEQCHGLVVQQWEFSAPQA